MATPNPEQIRQGLDVNQVSYVTDLKNTALGLEQTLQEENAEHSEVATANFVNEQFRNGLAGIEAAIQDDLKFNHIKMYPQVAEVWKQQMVSLNMQREQNPQDKDVKAMLMRAIDYIKSIQ